MSNLKAKAKKTISPPSNKPISVQKKKINTPKLTSSILQLQQKFGNKGVENLFESNVIQKQENHTGLPNNLKNGIESLSGYAMDDVKVHYNSSQPAQLNAHAFAEGSDIHLGAGQEKNLPHEAWHVVQQKQGRVQPTRQMKGKININDDERLEREADLMGDKALQGKGNDSIKQLAILNSNHTLQKKSLNELSKSEKSKLKIITKGVIKSFKGYFNHKGGRESMSLPENIKVFYNDNIPTKNDFRKDIKSVAADLLGTELVINSTITINVDLSETKNNIFRFTYIKNKIIIEGIAKPKSSNSKNQKDRILSAKIKFKNFGSVDKSKINNAINLLPNNILNRIYGVTFKRVHAENLENKNEGGHYSPATHTIVLYDLIFQENKNVLSHSIYSIMHEIGHVIDLRPLELVWKKHNGTSKVKKYTSESGAKWKIPKGKTQYEKTHSDRYKTPFIRAAQKDGIKKERGNRQTEVHTKATLKGGITSYSDTSWMELYAESYSIFKVDSKLLKELRPNIYAYFIKLEKTKYSKLSYTPSH